VYTYRLTRLGFNDGTTFVPGQLTIFVGPNNVGKSRALKEILSLAGGETTKRVIVRSLDFTAPESLDELLQAYDLSPKPHAHRNIYSRMTLSPSLCSGFQREHVYPHQWPEGIDSRLKAPETRNGTLAETFGMEMFAILTTEDRLKLVQTHDIQRGFFADPRLLEVTYQAGRQLELDVRNLVKHAFGREIALDSVVPFLVEVAS
jgi:hypothetical protein